MIGMSVMKNLVINADDFGLSKSVNRGIIESFQNGAVTSASLMVNMPGFEDATSLIAANPSLSVGLHINLLRGESVLCPNGLNKSNGNRFFDGNPWPLLTKINDAGLKEIEKECRAQVEKALRNNVKITHLDSEKNVHMIPKVFQLFVRIARDYQIKWVRNINENIFLSAGKLGLLDCLSTRYLISKYFSIIFQENRNYAEKNHVKTTDFLFGFFDGGGMTVRKLEKAMDVLQEGTTEMVCHPGYIDDEWNKYPLNKERYYINQRREPEVRLLKSQLLKELIKRENINLTSYRDL